jgi:hypothetical protein
MRSLTPVPTPGGRYPFPGAVHPCGFQKRFLGLPSAIPAGRAGLGGAPVASRRVFELPPALRGRASLHGARAAICSITERSCARCSRPSVATMAMVALRNHSRARLVAPAPSPSLHLEIAPGTLAGPGVRINRGGLDVRVPERRRHQGDRGAVIVDGVAGVRMA